MPPESTTAQKSNFQCCKIWTRARCSIYVKISKACLMMSSFWNWNTQISRRTRKFQRRSKTTTHVRVHGIHHNTHRMRYHYHCTDLVKTNSAADGIPCSTISQYHKKRFQPNTSIETQKFLYSPKAPRAFKYSKFRPKASTTSWNSLICFWRSLLGSMTHIVGTITRYWTRFMWMGSEIVWGKHCR